MSPAAVQTYPHEQTLLTVDDTGLANRRQHTAGPWPAEVSKEGSVGFRTFQGQMGAERAASGGSQDGPAHSYP